MIIFDRLISLVMFIGLFLSTGLAFYTWGRRNTAGGRAATAMLSAVSIWLGTNMIGGLFADPQIQFIFEKAGYLGVMTLPVAWFCFAMVSSGKERWLTRPRIGLLLVVPAFTLILVISGVFYNSVQFIEVNGYATRQVDFTGWVWLSSGYSYVLIGLGAILFIGSMIRSPFLQRYQIAALIMATIFPLISNVIYVTRILPVPIDITPFTFAISGVVVTIGFFRYNLFDVVPVARGAMVDRVNEGMIVVDASGMIADLNRAAERAMKVRLVEVIGSPLKTVVPALGDNPGSHAEISLAQASGVFYYEAISTPLYLQGSLLVGHLILLHDITTRKQVEVELKSALEQQRELNEMKSRFYLNLSHQLRTPLSVIMSSAEMLDHYSRDWTEEKRRRHFERIYTAIERLSGLSQQTAALEKAEHGLDVFRPEAFDPAEFFRQITDEIQSTDCNHHVIEAELRGDPQNARQDKALLRQVLENLLSNALKYSPHNSRIWFSLDMDAQELGFTIQDEGCGIPADELERVTLPFFRASNVTAIPGTGLGLAIANQYVRQMGGKLALESRLKEGTTARVTVPLRV
jgi:signal transduction histidine kinase